MDSSIEKPQKNKFPRLLSLDVFRGLTIALMILVNSPGNSSPYPWLEHSPWNGCTLADLVFPFFVFIVGLSSVFSLSKTRELGHLTIGSLIIKILKRSLIIFLLGLLLNALPNHFNIATFRFFGVLQRIALCYFFSSILFLTTSPKTQALIGLGLLIGYWLLLTQAVVPEYGVGQLTLEGNFAAYFDRLLLSPGHLYGKFYDPEGFLSTFPSIATALMGNLTGVWLLSDRPQVQKFKPLIFAGILSLIIGWFWSLSFPINKMLWSSSYVLWTGGYALLILALCYWLIEIKGWKRWSKPFEIFGANAMAAYVLHVLFLKIQAAIQIGQPGGASINLKTYICNTLFGWATAANAALLYALAYTLFWLFILTIFYRKKIFIKI